MKSLFVEYRHLRLPLHIIVRDGIVIAVIELGKRYGDPDRRLAIEAEYKVEDYHTCMHKPGAVHDEQCWVA